MNDLATSVLLGIGATAVMDAWGALRRPLLGWPVPDYAHLGRWVGHMPQGRFRHVAIAKSEPIRGERALGWFTHYLAGVGLAAVFVQLAHGSWLDHPSPGPALGFGVATAAVPFLLMQPAMGAGFAASRTSAPFRARLQSLVTHAVFGAGLYVAARGLDLATG